MTVFDDVVDGSSAAAVDGVEVEDLILAVGVPDDVAQDCVDTRRGVGHEDGCLGRYPEQLGDGLAGFVEQLWVLVPDERVWRGFGAVLVGAQLGLHEAWDGAEGAWM